jgi:hypothetical protein
MKKVEKAKKEINIYIQTTRMNITEINMYIYCSEILILEYFGPVRTELS